MKPIPKLTHPGRKKGGRKPSASGRSIVCLSLDPFDLEFIDKRSNLLGLSRSEYVRRVIRNVMKQLADERVENED